MPLASVVTTTPPKPEESNCTAYGSTTLPPFLLLIEITVPGRIPLAHSHDQIPCSCFMYQRKLPGTFGSSKIWATFLNRLGMGALPLYCVRFTSASYSGPIGGSRVTGSSMVEDEIAVILHESHPQAIG